VKRFTIAKCAELRRCVVVKAFIIDDDARGARVGACREV
jgi:hypothetical protein